MKKTLQKLFVPVLAVTALMQSCSKPDGSGLGMCNGPAFFYKDSAVTVILPNAFTPNGDGRNDAYHAVGLHIDTLTNFSLTVYNQAGTIAFHAAAPGTWWVVAPDTTFNQATYRYSVNLHFTSPAGRTIDTCIALYRLPEINGCNRYKDTTDLHKFVFEDQADIYTAQSPYPTGDILCPL